jgi:hypothetical protein
VPIKWSHIYAKIAFLSDSERSVLALLIEQSELRATSQPAN